MNIDMENILYTELQLCSLNTAMSEENRAARVGLELGQLSQAKGKHTLIHAITQQILKS